MPSVVFDASSLVGALLKANSVPEQALLLARTHATICLSPEIDLEIDDVLGRPKFRAARQRLPIILQIVRGSALWVQPLVKVTDCRDPKDNKYLELAWAAEADAIVSSDDDLLVLHLWRGISIVRPSDYVSRYNAPTTPVEQLGS